MDNKKWNLRIMGELEKLRGRELTPEEQARQGDLLQISMLLDNQNWKQMLHFINSCIARLNTDQSLALEVQQFVVERLADAWILSQKNPKARNNPIASALCLSGRPSKDQEHMDIAVRICEESFKYRHKLNATGLAIKSMSLEVKEDTAKRILKRWKPYALASIVDLTTDPRKRDYFRKQLTVKQRRELLLEK
jgi:hypothetical protein